MDKHWDYNIQKLVNKILENHKVKIVSHSLKTTNNVNYNIQT